MRRSDRNKSGLRWTVYPGMIGFSEDVLNQVHRLNKMYRKARIDQVKRAMAQPLPYGMAQLLVLSAELVKR